MCSMQILFGAQSGASGETFVLKSEAAAPASEYLISKTYYYYNSRTGEYVMDPSETETMYVKRGTFALLDYHTREGYVFKKMVLNNRITANKEINCMIFGDAYVDIYFDPLPGYEQVYRYYLYDPAKKEYELIKTQEDWAQNGNLYTTRIQYSQQGCHVKEVYLNDEKVSLDTNFSYEADRSNYFDIYLYPNQTTLEFYDDEGTKVGSQNVFYGEKQILMENPLIKPGYEFAGWRTVIRGESMLFKDREEFETPYTEDGAIIRMVTEWEPILHYLTLRYHTGGKKQETVYYEEQYEWEDEISFRTGDNSGKPEKPAMFLGWSLYSEKKEDKYTGEVQIKVESLYRRLLELGLIDKDEKEPVVDLYPVWDMAPQFGATHLYIARNDAMAGMVTPQFLLQKLHITDEEEGRLGFMEESETKLTGVWFTDYDAGVFLEGQTGEVMLSVEARDSGGNVTREQIVCTIVDSSGTYLGKLKKVRFITEEYLDTLDEDSIWNRNLQYRTLLEEVLEKARCICTSL